MMLIAYVPHDSVRSYLTLANRKVSQQEWFN
jgi:hypothetical protein